MMSGGEHRVSDKDMVQITINIPRRDYEKLKKLQYAGVFSSFSDIIRLSIKVFLKSEEYKSLLKMCNSEGEVV